MVLLVHMKDCFSWNNNFKKVLLPSTFYLACCHPYISILSTPHVFIKRGRELKT